MIFKNTQEQDDILSQMAEAIDGGYELDIHQVVKPMLQKYLEKKLQLWVHE